VAAVAGPALPCRTRLNQARHGLSPVPVVSAVPDIFDFADELGPGKVVHVYEPALKLQAVLVVDNTAAGPSIGGLRMAPDVTAEECFRLARAMTLKNAAAGLAHGGGKCVLRADAKMPMAGKQELIRALACALRDVGEYIFGPDMGTDERCMAWVHDEIGRAVGLPRELGGIPLDQIGATGKGILHVAEVAAPLCGLELAGARVVVQGFGAVGFHSARLLVEQGAVLVGAADSRGTIYNPQGLDVAALAELKRAGRPLIDYGAAEKAGREAAVDLECDIWIPAARPDVVREDNVDRLRTRLVIEGANVPVTAEAERRLHKRGILCVPDFIANAGGVICAAMEYQGASEGDALSAVRDKLSRNAGQVLGEAKESHRPPREVAQDFALRRVHRAMSFGRWASSAMETGGD